MGIKDVLAANIRKARQAKGLSQEELADLAKIDRTYISALERSLYAASIEIVDRLATALEMDASELLKQPARKT